MGQFLSINHQKQQLQGIDPFFTISVFSWNIDDDDIKDVLGYNFSSYLLSQNNFQV